jgi:Cdc6-like AAA superfamily ATPase
LANQRAIVEGLKFHDMTDRYQDVSDAADAAESTFEWIFQSPFQQLSSNHALVHPFKNWLENGDDIFHISGKPGSGKSTLMKFLCRHRQTESSLKRWAGEKELVLGKFFFWRRGSPMQKSLLGLIRALTYHVLKQCPNVIPDVFPQYWEPVRYDPWGVSPVVTIENEEILHAFRQVITVQDIYENYQFCFFIDSLDEFDEMLQTYTNLIGSLQNWVKSSHGHLKICVSSRELPVFQQRLDVKQRLRLQDLTKADIENIVKQTLEKEEPFLNQTLADKENLERLQAAIITKADGVFLWVILTLKALSQALQCDESISDLFCILDTMPDQLEEFFRHILNSIPIYQRRKAAFALAFALGTENLPIAKWRYSSPLWALLSPSLLRYSYLDEFADNPNFAIQQANNVPSMESIQGRIATCRTRLAGRCKGLLEFRPYGLNESRQNHQEIVRFTHRSIPEFLEEYLSSHWKMFLSGFDFVHAYIQTLKAALKLFQFQGSITDAKMITTELLGSLKVVRESQNSAITEYFPYLDDLDAVVYAKQIEGSPEFPHLTWTRFYSTTYRSPTFVSVFHTALKIGYHEYAAWKIRKSPEAIANGNAAEALMTAIHGIEFVRLAPNSWYNSVRSLCDISSTASLLLQQDVDPCSISLHPEDNGISAWGYLVNTLSRCHQGDLKINGLWAVVEVYLQFSAPLPKWSRNSELSLSISLAEISRDIEVARRFDNPEDVSAWFIPEALKKTGGSATILDFASLHAPPNVERIFEILETRE